MTASFLKYAISAIDSEERTLLYVCSWFMSSPLIAFRIALSSSFISPSGENVPQCASLVSSLGGLFRHRAAFSGDKSGWGDNSSRHSFWQSLGSGWGAAQLSGACASCVGSLMLSFSSV